MTHPEPGPATGHQNPPSLVRPASPLHTAALGPVSGIAGECDRRVWAAVLFVALTLVYVYPMSLRPASVLLDQGADTSLFMWTLAWDSHAFVHQPLSLFDANIYHPQRRTLAYSENLIGSALFAAPVVWVTDNPVLALNLVVLLSCALCGFGAYLLACQLGTSTPAAVLCGLVFAFSPARFFRITQLHLTTVQWIPFSLAFLHAYLEGGQKRHLRIGLAFVTLQALTTGHGAAFLMVALLTILAYRLALGEPIALAKRVRDVGVPGVLLLVPVALIFMPYRAVQLEMGLRRTLENTAPVPESFIASPSHVHAWLLSFLPPPHVNETASAFLFPGYLPLALAAVALVPWPAWRRASARQRSWWTRGARLATLVALGAALAAAVVTLHGPIRWQLGTAVRVSIRDPLRAWLLAALAALARLALLRRVPFDPDRRVRGWRDRLSAACARQRGNSVPAYTLLVLVCVLIAVGPPIGIWRFVYWLPGMSFIRVPSRFMVLAVLGIAVLAAAGFDRVWSGATPRRRRLAALVIGLAFVVESAAMPLRVVPSRVEIPAVDRWLASESPPVVVAEVPVQYREWFQVTYMLHSTAHWHKTVHGYSGLRPPLHEDLYANLRRFPDEPSLRMLAGLGVTHVVVHTDYYPPGVWPEIERRLAGYGDWLTLRHSAGPGRVYELREPTGIPPP